MIILKAVVSFVYEKIKDVSQIGLLIIASICFLSLLIPFIGYSLRVLQNELLFILLLLVLITFTCAMSLYTYKRIANNYCDDNMALQLNNEIIKQSVIMNAVTDALIILDANGKIKAVNKTMCGIIGLDEAFIINKALPSIASDDDNCEITDISRIIIDALEKNIEYRNMIKLQNINGLSKDLSISTYILREKENEKIGIIAVIKDITEKKRIENRMMHIEKLTTVGRMAANLAHEIKNPMCSIKGLLQLMKQNANEKDERYCHVMLNEIDRVSTLLKNFLSLTQTKTEFEIANIEQILLDLMPLLESQAFSKNIKINAIIDPNLPESYCCICQIKQVILNITQNAMEALQDKGIISIRVFKDTDSDMIKIEIADNGPGIRHDYINKIFDPFFTSKDNGSGLGLHISYKIIENHAGKIYTQNNEKHGCTFVVELPIRKNIENSKEEIAVAY